MEGIAHSLHDRVVGCILGSAVGDAMGGPVEGLSPAEIEARHGIVDRMLPYPPSVRPSFHGPFGTAAGECTDDTRLAKLVCEGLIRSGGLPRAGDVNRAIYAAFQSAASPLERGFLEEYALKAAYGPGKEAFGGKATNGAIMAIAPVGVLFPGDPRRGFDAAFDIMTMATGSARISAAAAAACISAAAVRGGKALDAVLSGLDAAEERLHRTEGSYWHYGRMYQRVGGWSLVLARKAVDAAKAHEGPVDAGFAQRLSEEVGQPFFADGDETLAVALAMFVAAQGDFRRSVIGAVNYGKDCDSYAAVAGALAGAFNGASAIPAEWVAAVESRDAEPGLRRLADGLCATVASRMRREPAFDLPPPFARERRPAATGLLDAVRAGDEKAVGLILAEGADPDGERDERGKAALHLACAAGHLDVVKTLLLFGASIDHKDPNETTALHFAAWQNHLEIVDLLLDWGIFPEETEGRGWTALHDSVRREYHDIALRILAKSRNLTRENELTAELGALGGEDRFLRLLHILAEYHVDLGAIGMCGHGLLHDAKKRGYERAAAFLIESGVADEP